MWFVLSLIAVAFWGVGDLFSKLGSEKNDKLSHWKITVAVGTVMGIHATAELILGAEFHPEDFIKYFPAIFCYITSMIVGYAGLRYIMLSVSSPICNSSGAIAGVLCLIFLKSVPDAFSAAGTVLVAIGVTGLAFAEERENESLSEKDEKKYKKSLFAIVFPIIYCLLDGLGTFADALILDSGSISEESANIAYEYTFFFIGLLALFYVYVIKKEKIRLKADLPKAACGVCETAGQFAYIYAIGSNPVVVAPMVSSYCVLSVVMSRIFLKEKLNIKQKITVFIVFAGIILMGISEGISG